MTERPAPLTNPRSDRVRMVRRLAGRSARGRHGQYLVEGPQAVREAVRHAPEQLRDLYLTPEAAGGHASPAEDGRRGGYRVHIASRDVLDAMSPDAQGQLAVARVPEPPPLDDLLTTGLLAVLARASDPGNLGTMIRTADAAGAGGVVTGPGSAEPHSPKVVRATAGSLFHLPVLDGAALEELLPELQGRGWQVLAADGAGGWDLDDLADAVATGRLPAVPGGPDLRRPTAWLLGNEAHGLSDAQRAMADAVVRVPIHGLAESLNVATAGALCLYASARAHLPR